MTSITKAIDENVWDAANGLVLVNKVNGVEQMISIDTINGEKVKSFDKAECKKKVKEVFPNGLPRGMNVVFISVANDNND